MNNTSAYLVAVPELKPSTRVVPMVFTALLHVAAIAILVKGLVVIPGQKVREEFEVINIPETKIEHPIDNPLPPDQMNLTHVIDIPPALPPVFVVEKAPVDEIPTETWASSGGGIDTQTRTPSVVAPKLLHKYEPPYPPASRRMGEQGVVKLMLSVAPNGQVIRAEVLQSSGYSRLDQAAIDAVQSWRYSPAQRDGVSVSESIPVLVRFSLT